MITPRVGERFAVVFVITRPVATGEIVDGNPISNLRGNLWWSRPDYSPNHPELLCCLEPYDQKYFEAAKWLEAKDNA